MLCRLGSVQGQLEIPPASGPVFRSPEEGSTDPGALMARVHGKLVNAGNRRIAIPVHRRRTIDAVHGDGSDNPPVGDRNEAVAEPDALARDGNSLIDTSAVEALSQRLRVRDVDVRPLNWQRRTRKHDEAGRWSLATHEITKRCSHRDSSRR